MGDYAAAVGVSASSGGGSHNLGSSRTGKKPSQEIKRESEMSMESSAPINIPGKSWIKDNNSSFSSNSPSLSSSFGHQEMSSLTSSPVHSSFNPPGCPNCSSSSCTAAFNPSFSPCSSFSRMTELSASTRRKRTSSWSNVWNTMARHK